MFVKQNKSHKGTLLTYTIGYRENGKVKHKNIETIGYLEELKKIYDDPVAHFREEAKKRNNQDVNELVIKNLNSKIIDSENLPKNLGYIILKKLYSELNLDLFFNSKQKDMNCQYNLNSIFSLLIFSRILFPSSKKVAFENKHIFFDDFDFSIDALYRSLSTFNKFKEEMEELIWQNTKETYKRDTSSSYYDCTNYYFEIEYNDDDLYELDDEGNIKLDSAGNPIILEKGYRKRGVEKNKRPDPIIEMGLLMDATGLPLAYDLFPGNQSEKNSLVPILKRIKSKFNLERTVVVADRGLNCSDNIIHIAGISLEQSETMDGYLYGQSVRGADLEFKQWVLNQEGYIEEKINENNEEIIFKHKSRVYPKTMYVNRNDKSKTKGGNLKREKIIVDQKQMVYYSQKYANKQKKDREMMIKKARDLIKNPDKYTKSTSYGAAAYINNIQFVKDTGEVANSKDLSINEEKIKEEEKYDGYYSIVTSEEKLSDLEIRKIYRGLAKIEETFKVTKSSLETRPVYVRTKDHIESHFLICFVSLVIIRLLEKKLDNNYSVERIINSLKNYSSCNIEHDIYLQPYIDNILNKFEELFNVSLSQKYMTLSKIKKMLG